MISAIAAGNCVVMKPSELSPEVSQTLATLVEKYMDQSAVPHLSAEVWRLSLRRRRRLGERSRHREREQDKRVRVVGPMVGP